MFRDRETPAFREFPQRWAARGHTYTYLHDGNLKQDIGELLETDEYGVTGRSHKRGNAKHPLM